MYNKLYDNCFKTELNTKVLHVQEEDGMYWHACKDTIFYKESGGMASDIGMIDHHMVHALKSEDGYLWHLLDTKLEGTVFMSVNLHERFHKCQVHTAQHLISSVLSSVYKVTTLSHHVSDDENDVEFDFPDFNDKMAFELQVLCNGLIRDDLDVCVLYPTRTEASQYVSGEALMRNDLRVVRIGALDYNLCGCMHVPSLRYLQLLFIQGYEKTARGYKIKYLVGDQLLDCLSKRYSVLDSVGRSLAVSHLYVESGVNRMINENRKLNKEISDWKSKYCDILAKELSQCEDEIIKRQFDDLDVKSAAQLAQQLCETYHKAIIFIVKIYDNVHVIVGKNKTLSFDVKQTFDEIAAKYHLKGGGNELMAQGGGIYKEEIKELLK